MPSFGRNLPAPVGASGMSNVDPTASYGSGTNALTRQLEQTREQTFQDLAEQEAYKGKHHVASHQGYQMIRHATANHGATLDALEDFREQQRASWSRKRREAWSDDAATMSHRHQAGYVEAAGLQIAATAVRSVTPPPKGEPSFLDRLLGNE